MKQICKRLSAIFLVLTLVSGSVLTNEIVAKADNNQEPLFSDNFDDYADSTSESNNQSEMDANGWELVVEDEAYTTVLGTYNKDKKYHIPWDKKLKMVTGSSEWKDYSVEAKIKFESNSNAKADTRAGILGHLNNDNIGYELQVKMSADSKPILILQYAGKNLEQKTVTIPSEGIVLKLEFRGTMIYGYLNHEIIIAHNTAYVGEDKKSSQGWAGIRKSTDTGMDVVFDDFVVSTVTGSYPEGYLYYNNFNDKNATPAGEGFVTDETTTISGGYLNIEKSKRAYLPNVGDSLNWENYVVESDVMIVKQGDEKKTVGYAGIMARSNGTKDAGYEYRIQYNKGKVNLQLLKNVAKNTTTAFATKNYKLEDFSLDKSYKLTMAVYNNGDNGDKAEIRCWFTDYSKPLEEQTKLIFYVVDEKSETETPYLKGCAGVGSAGGTGSQYLSCKYDNLIVKEYQPLIFNGPDGYLYGNDFSNPDMRLEDEGWSSNEGTKNEGVYVLEPKQSNYLTGVAGSLGWTDYVVEANVMINYNDSNSNSFDQYAAIVGRSTDTKNSGYELRLIRRADGDVIRLFKKGADDWKINGELNTAYITLEQGKDVKLKMVFRGADIYCYLNGEIVFEVTDNTDPYLEGYAGVISQGGKVSSTYDNVVVRNIDNDTDFPANATYPYYNNFSALRSLNKEGWESSGTKQNGAYVLDEGTSNYLTNVDKPTGWDDDYVVEADVWYHGSKENRQLTSITARNTDYEGKTFDKGYEWRLYTDEDGNAVVRLFKCEVDEKGKITGKINDKVLMTNVSVIPNTIHSLKMVVQGATITCYLDGVKMFEVTDNNEPFMTGYAGVRSSGGTAKSSFDYFAVREIGDADIVKDPVINQQDGDIWFYDNFKGEESMTDRGWSTDKVALYNGSALVKGKVIVDEVQGSDKWTDYEVSAIVFLDKEAGMYEETSSGVAAICARTTSSGAGYEFGISASDTSNSYLRLYDRKNGVTLATNEKIPVTTGEHTLRMVCIGKEIYCFFDETLAITAQSDAAANGYAGMRASSYNAYYKEFTVRKARPIFTILQSGSPNTGDSGMNMAVVYTVAIVCSLSMIGFVVTTYYSRKKYV